MPWNYRAGVCAALMAAGSAAAQHCGDWRVVAPPDPLPGNFLIDLSGTSERFLWSLDLNGGVAHFDGSSWNAPPPPPLNLFGRGHTVNAVAATDGGSVWAGGYATSGYPTAQEPVVARLRGGAGGTWEDVEAIELRPQREYPYARRGGMVMDMLALREDEVWAVGLAAGFGDGRATVVPLALRYDGTKWNEQETPRPGSRFNTLTSVAAAGSDDVWAVGHYRSVAATYQALTMHWDGSQWRHVSNPAEAVGQTFLTAVAVLAPDDVWAAGHINYSQPLFMHWDGSSWRIVPAPPAPGGEQREISALAAIASDDIWAADILAGELYHYDGVSWSVVESAARAPGSSYGVRAMAPLGRCDVMSVGAEVRGGQSSQFVERLSFSSFCYADCDGTGALDFFDFLCFQNHFATGDPQADCDGSSGLDFFDFLCFQDAFASGCP